MKNPKILYRYERYYDYMYEVSRQDKVKLVMYNILRYTLSGVWIKPKYKNEKWVSLTGKKRFAYPTKKEALDNFIKRTAKAITRQRIALDASKNFLTISKEIKL